MRALKFATLNCVSLLARRRKQWVLDTILHERVDVAFLQETKIATDGQVEELTRFFDRHFVIFLSRAFGQSGGTAIMIRKKKNFAICPEWEGDRNGRVCAVEMLHCGQLHRLVSVYAPNDATERRDFFKNLRQYLDTPCRTILAGDFNCVLAERDCSKRLKADVSRPELRKLLRDFDLVDAKDNEKTADPTYTHWQGNCHARLDRIYLSGEFSAMTPVLEVLPLAFSDHALVTVTLGRPVPRTRKSSWWSNWKLNESLIEDEQLRTQIKELLEGKTGDIRDCKGNILELLEKEYRGAMVRSRTLFLERDEEPSKIFKTKERQHASRNKIGKLQVGDVEVTRQEEIEDAFLQAYTDLFTKVEDDGVLQTTGVALPKISPKVRKQMNRKITASEVEEAIKELAPRKSPGVDGLGSQFYKTFSAQLCPILRDVYADVLKRGLLPPSMRQAVTVLIQKKNSKGTPKVDHCRPISLLTSDYKILAKILAKRLEWGLRDVVGEHQAYGIKRRTISTNLHAMRIVCEAAQVLKLPVAVLQLLALTAALTLTPPPSKLNGESLLERIRSLAVQQQHQQHEVLGGTVGADDNDTFWNASAVNTSVFRDGRLSPEPGGALDVMDRILKFIHANQVVFYAAGSCLLLGIILLFTLTSTYGEGRSSFDSSRQGSEMFPLLDVVGGGSSSSGPGRHDFGGDEETAFLADEDFDSPPRTTPSPKGSLVHGGPPRAEHHQRLGLYRPAAKHSVSTFPARLLELCNQEVPLSFVAFLPNG
ncbi:hypothetical protein ISCGN_004645 [Ixodes scapularis]